MEDRCFNSTGIYCGEFVLLYSSVKMCLVFSKVHLELQSFGCIKFIAQNIYIFCCGFFFSAFKTVEKAINWFRNHINEKRGLRKHLNCIIEGLCSVLENVYILGVGIFLCTPYSQQNVYILFVVSVSKREGYCCGLFSELGMFLFTEVENNCNWVCSCSWN